jgi:hypothetical protein
MKNKVVLWGTNAANEKVLIALELQSSTNKVQLYTFPEAIATEDFVTLMMQEWRTGKEVAFPEGHGHIERELSVAENLLPEDIKVDRTDIINRAQTEWHFAVLAAKLNEAYRQELVDFKEKVSTLTKYDAPTWEGLKGLWDKVGAQVRERNLWREHADELRDGINALFEDLKKMRSQVNEEFAGSSKKIFEEVNAVLDAIDVKIAASSTKMGMVFEELKATQAKYKDAKLTNEHRNKVWDRLDASFKTAKEKRFGPNANEGSASDRQGKRLEGLADAIKRMEESLKRDQEELDFQAKKVAVTEGQLEAQIRSAKIKMVEERLGSKKEKLAEMYATRADIEKQAVANKEKDAKRAERDSERQRYDKAKEQAKSEISASSTKLAAVETVATPKAESLFEAASTILGEVFEDAIDSIKAVVQVVSEKAEDAMEEMAEKAEKVIEVMNEEKTATVVETKVSEIKVVEPSSNIKSTITVVGTSPVVSTSNITSTTSSTTTTVLKGVDSPAIVVTEGIVEVVEKTADDNEDRGDA